MGKNNEKRNLINVKKRQIQAPKSKRIRNYQRPLCPFTTFLTTLDTSTVQENMAAIKNLSTLHRCQIVNCNLKIFI
jgi:hypothetical protein